MIVLCFMGKNNINLTEMIFLKMCLLCFERNTKLLEIFGKQEIGLNVGTILEEHFWFEFDMLVGRSICENCWEKVESFHIFYNFVKSIHQQHAERRMEQICETKAIIDNGLIYDIKEEPIDIKEHFDVFTDTIPDTIDFPAVGDTTVASVATVPHRTGKSAPRSSKKFIKTDAQISQYFNMACDLCNKSLSSYRDTKKHYKDVHDINKGYLICCNKKYVRRKHMLSHCEWHMNPDAFKCSQCSKNFIDKYRLNKHFNYFHAAETEKIFNCDYCDKNFSKLYYLNAHQKEHTTLLKCPICQKGFTGKRSLSHHVQDVHSLGDELRSNIISLKKVDNVKEEAKKFECDICGRRFAILPFLRNHIKSVHCNAHRNVNSYICEKCAKAFKTKTDYEKHYINVHTKIPEKVAEKVQCEICSKWFQKRLLKIHISQKHDNKPATCKICGRVCKNGYSLRQHIQRVHREPSLECTACGKMFKTKTGLKEHMAMHAGITDLYTCKFCTKTFMSNANMYKHRKQVHSEELKKI